MVARIEITAATPADTQQLAEIYLVDRQQDFPWATEPKLGDFEQDSRGEFVLVAWIDGQMAGFCSLYRVANFIHLLFVAPAYRHLKVGEHLLAEMRQYATEPMTLKCVIENKAALHFYDKMGFEIVKTDQDAFPANYTLRDTHTEQYVARQVLDS